MALRGGVDLGGTKIEAVVVDDGGSVSGRARTPTPTKGGPQAVASAIAAALREAANGAGVDAEKLAGVGVGAPGTVSNGNVANARNLPDWKDAFPLAETLGAELGVPVAVANDVGVAVDAETALGAGKGRESLLGVWWGTGVGGAIVVKGKRWLGRGGAGEIGHTVVRMGGRRCECGSKGCLEAYAGRGSMERRARKLVKDGEKTVLFDLMEKHGRPRLTSGIWERALDEGDKLAEQLIDEAYAALGAGIASAVNLTDVGTVVIGGGLGTRFGDRAASRIASEMHPYLFIAERPPDVVPAALGDLGGAIGASLLVATTPGERVPA
jgi:glucokinase